MTQQYDILIIGAGPSGSISAAALLKKGYSVVVIEKETFPRFVIGESLLPRCMQHLDELDLIDVIKKDDYQEKFGAIFYNNKDESCDFNFADQFEKESWKWTWQVQRANFDKTIANEVERRGACYKYNTSVQNVEIGKTVITTIESNNQSTTIESKFIIDASGYGRVLPRLFDLNKPSPMPPRASYFAHLKDHHRKNDAISKRTSAIDQLNNVWAWNIPFSTGITSVGFVGEEQYSNPDNLDIKENFLRLINSCPFFQRNYDKIEFEMEPKKISAYSIGVKKMHGDKFVLTGNSTEFLDPIFSSGVCFAIESGMKAAQLVHKELSNEKVDWDNEYSEYMQQGIDTFRSYVNAWYSGDLQKIFFSKNQQASIKEQICSVLAGYAWDKSNPFVKKHKTIVSTLAKVIDL